MEMSVTQSNGFEDVAVLPGLHVCFLCTDTFFVGTHVCVCVCVCMYVTDCSYKCIKIYFILLHNGLLI